MLGQLSREEPYKFIVLYTKDDRVFDLVTEELLANYRIRKDSLQVPASREALNESYQLGYTMPLGLSRWLFKCDNDTLYLDKKSMDALETTETATFLIKTSDFKSFNIVKRMLQGIKNTLILSLGFIRRDDMQWLQERIIKDAENRPSLEMNRFIQRGYGMYPIKLLDILEASNKGKLTTRKEIIALAGAPENTQEKFILKLLDTPPTSARGLKIRLANRTKEGYALGEEKTFRALRNYLIHTVKDILHIKTLMIKGELYRDVARVETLEEHDKRRLRRYNKFLSNIKEVPVSRIITLLSCLTSTTAWFSEVDLLNFLYKYFYTLYRRN